MDWTIGLLVAATAMIGDLFSSFAKRRMKLAPGSTALGLDQIPESLLPVIACRWLLPITALDIVLVPVLKPVPIPELLPSRQVVFDVRGTRHGGASGLSETPNRAT
jgi:hypothetical protein